MTTDGKPLKGYKVCYAQDIEELADQVMIGMEAGWELHGEMQITTDQTGDGGTYSRFFQPMVKPRY